MIKAEVLSHRSDHNTKQMRCCVRDKCYVHGLIEELNMLTQLMMVTMVMMMMMTIIAMIKVTMVIGDPVQIQ